MVAVKKEHIWYGITAFLIALVVVAWIHPSMGGFNQLSAAQAGDKVKQLYESAYSGMNFTVANVTSEGGLYLVTLQVSFNGKTQTITSGITKDGKYFTPTVISVSQLEQQIANNQQQQPQSQKFEPKKTAKPNVMLFVMPFCPFGQPAENAMYSVSKLLGNNIDYKVHYIVTVLDEKQWNEHLAQVKSYLEQRGASESQIAGYIKQMNESAVKVQFNGTTYYVSSLHGKNEAQEVMRQLCIWKYYPNKAIDYIWGINHDCSLQNVTTCWTTVATKLGIDTNKIETCYNNEGVELALQEQALDQKYGVSASPTMIINGVVYNGERTSTGYKNAICESFTTEPSACNQAVNETATTPAGSCNT